MIKVLANLVSGKSSLHDFSSGHLASYYVTNTTASMSNAYDLI